MEARAQVTETTEHRCVVSWEGPGQPILLTVYGPDGEVAELCIKAQIIVASPLV